jgi:hypothetical protein
MATRLQGSVWEERRVRLILCDRMAAIAPGAVHLQITPDVIERDKLGQCLPLRRLNFAAAFSDVLRHATADAR